MVPLTQLFVASLLVQAVADTVPLPPLDSAWGLPERVELSLVEPPDSVPVWVAVDAWGRVQNARVDTVAVRLGSRDRERVKARARSLRFAVALDHPVGWCRVTFPAKSGGRVEDFHAEEETAGRTRRPKLKNKMKAMRLLDMYYAPELKKAGVGGGVELWAFIDTTGRVQSVRLPETSGYRGLDEAAERVAWQLEFEPAMNRGRKVPVWIAQEINWAVDRQEVRWLKRHEPREFTLGPPDYPVADGRVNRILPTRPEVVRPDRLERRLSRLYRETGPSGDLSVWVEVDVDWNGSLLDLSVLEVRPKSASESKFVSDFVRVLRETRFRPGADGSIRKRVSFTAWFVFDGDLGLIPSVPPDACGVRDELRARPTFTPVDEPARMATPKWEANRIIGEVWPLTLQKRGKRYRYPLWLLVDERGRVCVVRLMEEEDDRWVASKVRKIARRLRFSPAQREGKAVASWTQEALVFSF